MTTFKLHGDPESAKRFGHGTQWTYVFHTKNGIVILSCIFDSTKYSSPGAQIIEENPDIIKAVYQHNKTRPVCPIHGAVQSRIARYVPYATMKEDVRRIMAEN